MDLTGLKGKFYFFDKSKYGRIYVFVDFGNVRPWAKEFWGKENKLKIYQEVDIAKLAEVINWIFPIKKLFYYGHYLKNENFSEEHKNNNKYRLSIFRLNKARKSGFEVKTKEIKMISHFNESGAFLEKTLKCNFDVEITMDMIIKAEKYDSIMLFSGDSDFGGLLSYLKSKGKKIIVVCTRNRMSEELRIVADIFIPAETLKRFLKLENN
jgi:uncharacterized LabA/DUF88 family protein